LDEAELEKKENHLLERASRLRTRAKDAEKLRNDIGESREEWAQLYRPEALAEGDPQRGDDPEGIQDAVAEEWRRSYHRAVRLRRELEETEDELAELALAKRRIKIRTDNIILNFRGARAKGAPKGTPKGE